MQNHVNTNEENLVSIDASADYFHITRLYKLADSGKFYVYHEYSDEDLFNPTNCYASYFFDSEEDARECFNRYA